MIGPKEIERIGQMSPNERLELDWQFLVQLSLEERQQLDSDRRPRNPLGASECSGR